MSLDKRLTDLESRMGYQFSDRQLLERAITHGSFGDGRRSIQNYERLEFLGDRVLGLLTAEILYSETGEDEGGLARKLNALVRKETCADVAEALGVASLMLMSPSADRQKAREKISILGDVAESILGAIYLDGGLDAARMFYLRFWHEKLAVIIRNNQKDPKTELQERAAAQKFQPPVYEIVEKSGPDHRPHFQIRVTVTDKGTAEGEGATKKLAERQAAIALLEQWGNP